ncbi:hypothetical protein [Tanapox virus]|uniref:Uncharacterized protein 42L n=1 Tax=Tanapox virus TaxID=99000 RepID=A7XCF9_9POXV|nr:hypothetical protein [Tanapox virus]ABQ43671.1 hypothetical protein [Tanapox virus]
MTLYMYPKNARKALSKLISKKLIIDKVSKKHIKSLLDYGIHGLLPESVYDYAIRVDIKNIRFFQPNVVRITDLIKVLKTSSVIDTKLYNAIIVNKKKLLESGIHIIKLIVNSDLITKDDIDWMLENKIIGLTSLLKIKPSLASKQMNLSKEEIIDIVKNIPSYNLPYLYDNILMDLDTVIYLSDEFNIPPLNYALFKLASISKALELVKKYPEENIVDYLPNAIKKEKRFLENVNEIVLSFFPNMITSINKLLLSEYSKDYLIKKYGVRSVAMFNFVNLEIKMDDLTQTEKEFIEKNIIYYDTNCRDFAIKFRNIIMNNENRVITMNANKPIQKIMKISSSIRKSIVVEKNSIEEILIHIDNARTSQKLSKNNIESLLYPFRLNPCVVRNVLLSNSKTKTKIIALKVIKNWKSQSITPTSTFYKTKGVIIMDMMDYIATKVLHNYVVIFDKFKKLENGPSVLSCKCYKCKNEENNLKSKNIVLSKNSSDDDLINCLHDLVRYAVHGYVNPSIIKFSGWGPLIGFISGNRKIKNDMFIKIMENDNLIDSSVNFSGINLVSKLVYITSVSLESIIGNKIFPLNDSYAKVVILLNVILEYMFVILMYRLIVNQRFTGVREFVSKIVNKTLESSGVYFCQIKTNENINIEIDELLSNGSTPVYLIHLFLKVVSIILEEINGSN